MRLTLFLASRSQQKQFHNFRLVTDGPICILYRNNASENPTIIIITKIIKY